ncbi:uncharacterized protein LOC129215058 isoform X3 [Grus americana]|uniref:uncharacterized protein LOC129215058 isoform X3 n=1 Tax=Grus americana TaxID=9117 RepID=UPI0024081B29|nr:uncharacterized protein LOC129215058 isoform X3 [Grus americana]
MSRDPRYYEPDPIKALRAADSAAPPPAPSPAGSRGAPGPGREAPGPAGDTEPPTADAPLLSLQSRSEQLPSELPSIGVLHPKGSSALTQTGMATTRSPEASGAVVLLSSRRQGDITATRSPPCTCCISRRSPLPPAFPIAAAGDRLCTTCFQEGEFWAAPPAPG